MAEAIKSQRSVRGRDLINGPISRTLVAFALPTLASNILQSLNGSINAMWVGRLVGKVGLAATANANLLMFVMFALTFGFGMAATILVGQNMGRRDLDAVRRTVGAGVGLFAVIGICVAFIGWLELPALLHALSTPADVYPQAVAYARVMFLGLPAGLIVVFLQMSLRGTGDSLTPLLFIIPSCLVDVGLNPVLILGLGPAPRMGIAGSAASSLIANSIVAVALLFYIYLRDLPIRLRGKEWRYLFPARDLIFILVRKGTPMGLQMIFLSLAAVVLIGLVNREGTSTVAAYGAASQLFTYIQMPALAVGAAVSAMAAQNIGAGRWDRIDRIAGIGVLINFLMSGLLVLAIALADRFLIALFLGDDLGAISIGRHINRLASWGFILSGTMMALSAVPRANGATIAPLIILTTSLLPGQLGFAYGLYPRLGPDAIWWSFPVGYLIATVMTVAYYFYGSWRKIRLLSPPSPAETDEIMQTESAPAGRVHPAA
jgi:putative MATE family efflux protein